MLQRTCDSYLHQNRNKEIAAELHLSIRTVENHISHIYAKKGFVNRVEIARYMFEREHKS